MVRRLRSEEAGAVEIPSPPALPRRAQRQRTDGMKIGYARVSTEDQRLDLQTQALKTAACARVFTDHGLSGSNFSRPGLDAALLELKPGNTLVVWRMASGSPRPLSLRTCPADRRIG